MGQIIWSLRHINTLEFVPGVMGMFGRLESRELINDLSVKKSSGCCVYHLECQELKKRAIKLAQGRIRGGWNQLLIRSIPLLDKIYKTDRTFDCKRNKAI